MSKGSRFSSILEWFRTGGSIDEVRAIMPLCIEAVQKRTAAPGARAKRAAPKTTAAARSAAAKLAWTKRRLNAVDKATQATSREEEVA